MDYPADLGSHHAHFWRNIRHDHGILGSDLRPSRSKQDSGHRRAWHVSEVSHPFSRQRNELITVQRDLLHSGRHIPVSRSRRISRSAHRARDRRFARWSFDTDGDNQRLYLGRHA